MGLTQQSSVGLPSRASFVYVRVERVECSLVRRASHPVFRGDNLSLENQTSWRMSKIHIYTVPDHRNKKAAPSGRPKSKRKMHTDGGVRTLDDFGITTQGM
jgi:hypothetical protein